ncbi:membrane integrity-associated transporter subunit PqiC [uncultured Tateyamaria sp.]|uniref:PqiC family protein n=1 Tax=uncultured Tateyamaria sp. TaxID=455651 RepID=UPI002607D685|nr:ABC-type transport auxiliary lipoprotein family protein [uncultured Tateyamaria sp.]
MIRLVAATALLFLVACGSEPPTRFEAASEPTPERVRIAYKAVSIRDVSLPTYAATEEISSADLDGRLSSSGSALWADDPVRAITLDVARALREVSGARVAPDPWPYQSRPEATVDIRFEELIPDANGEYRAAGLYFVAPDDEDRVEHAHEFAFSIQYDVEAGFAALAAARAQLANMLVLDIAQTALR